VYEDVPAERFAEHVHRLLVTPGLVEDVAAGDLVELDDDGSLSLLERGGNVAVKLYTGQPQAVVEKLVDHVEEVGGWLDGLVPESLVVLTFPSPIRW
jgi:hypothetical protein